MEDKEVKTCEFDDDKESHHEDHMWAVFLDGSTRTSGLFTNRTAAIEHAAEVANRNVGTRVYLLATESSCMAEHPPVSWRRP